MVVVFLVAIKSVNPKAVLLDNVSNHLDGLVLNIYGPLVVCNPMVNGQSNNLRQGVDFDSALDQVNSLRGLDDKAVQRCSVGEFHRKGLKVTIS
ncbi:uncharacterized protein APUU_80177S [Aspergillus puulaauensis]|uniref:Uncharacterized protein n=1 Tax=Aspergillus puulaauensis TaxID=1220207 RepID=A0A7R8ARY9_9EURO|nr:uncharacterized protein APUU_80177S [Aspergillus puulaauensis]BCS29874.1 hypothetical protein APUU_80177S [Aspergillus puulaauensis]